jgi:hypothetical protein
MRYRSRDSQTERNIIMSRIRIAATAALLVASTLSIGSAYAAQGCGPYGWRGPWGHCHFAHAVIEPGPVVYSAPVVSTYACPPGYWLGPWGHCRDTPYHGRLPNGGWQ